MSIAFVSYIVAAAFWTLLTVLAATSWRGRLNGGVFALAVGSSALWSSSAAVVAAGIQWIYPFYLSLEIIRAAAWLIFLARLLAPLKRPEAANVGKLGFVALHSFILGLALLLILVAVAPLVFDTARIDAIRPEILIAGFLVLALFGLVLVEQIYRNSHPERRWALKYLVIGLGVLFSYDFFLYADALLFKNVDIEFWQARGFVNALLVPLLAIAAARNPDWSLNVFVSRKVVFHSVSIAGAGIYLLAMSAVGFYIRQFGGSWGGAVQIAFLVFALALLVVLLFSGQMRTRLKIFLNKHFFNYRYDYREEWLKLSRLFAEQADHRDPREGVIRSLAEIVDSTGGVLWSETPAGDFACSAQWNMGTPITSVIKSDQSLVKFLRDRQWIVDLPELEDQADIYEGLKLPEAVAELHSPWLIIPLLQGEQLRAIVLLARPRAPKQLNWEDRDLLKAMGLQLGNYLSLIDTTEALMNARQFEAFNRLSSYVVHDLKNVSAQLNLLVRNASKHKDKPEFVDDAFSTVANAAAKMDRMLAQLRKGDQIEAPKEIAEVHDTVKDAIALCAGRLPLPVLRRDRKQCYVLLERERLVNVLAHLIQNAQEATGDDGEVTIEVGEAGDYVEIAIIDNGEGMTEQFVRERLFRPFDTTKGNAGMGIGVYESREFIGSQGGDISVRSKRSQGTRFVIRLPLYQDAPETVAPAETNQLNRAP